MAVDLARIKLAQQRLQGLVNLTPIIESEELNQRYGGRILFKAECLQRTGSFKIRGASNKLLSLSAENLRNGVVAYSSGNHAQGVAAAAQAMGVPATIVIPRDAPALKIANTRAFGAEVVLYERNSESREQIAADIASQKSAAIVPPYDDEDVIAGQGTVGLEILDQLGFSPDAVLCPCGGGGLVSGLATALKGSDDSIDVFAVEPENFDDTCRSLELGQRVANAAGVSSICDAIVTPTPGEITFEINRRLLSGGIKVSDDMVRQAVIEAYTRLKLVVEPGAAVGLAALCGGQYQLQGKTIVIVLSGGNMDIDTLIQIRQSSPDA
ncbi:MAG: threonine dehydratase [Planctomycetota bacterium]